MFNIPSGEPWWGEGYPWWSGLQLAWGSCFGPAAFTCLLSSVAAGSVTPGSLPWKTEGSLSAAAVTLQSSVAWGMPRQYVVSRVCWTWSESEVIPLKHSYKWTELQQTTWKILIFLVQHFKITWLWIIVEGGTLLSRRCFHVPFMSSALTSRSDTVLGQFIAR